MRPTRFAILMSLSLLGVAGCAAPAAPAADPKAVEQGLRQRADSLQAAEAAFDVARAMTFWADDAIIQPAGTPQVSGRAAIEALYHQYFTSGMLKAFSGSVSTLSISASGDMAWQSGVNRMVLKGDKGDLLDVGKYVAVWQQRNGVWMVVALSFTSDAPVPVPAPAAPTP